MTDWRSVDGRSGRSGAREPHRTRRSKNPGYRDTRDRPAAPKTFINKDRQPDIGIPFTVRRHRSLGCAWCPRAAA